MSIPTLTERDLYCIARHVQQHVEETKYDRVADASGACVECKFMLSGTCKSNPHLADPWPTYGRLRELTGVNISPFCRSKDLLEP